MPLIATRCGSARSLLPLVVIIAAAAACFLPTSVAARGPLPVRVCHVPVQYIGTDRIWARHALFATRYLAPRFPSLNVSFDYATENGGPTMTQVARGLLTDRARACDAYVGPQWSSVSIGISALVNVPWVSHTATSTALSDKDQHPWFSRMLPTDDFGGAGMAAAAQAFGWRFASAICVDDAYGQSLLSGFRRRHVLNGGILENSVCLLKDADNATAHRAVVSARATARGKVIVIAGSASAAVVGLLVDAVVRLGMQNTHAFIFSESACGLRWSRLSELPGAFCVSYTTNSTITRPYDSAWLAHDPAALFAGNAALGIPAPDDLYATGLFTYLMHDCVLSLLSAFDGVARGLGEAGVDTNFTSKTDISLATRQLLRRNRIDDGATGPIVLDNRGDRTGALLVINNVVPAREEPDGFRFESFATWSPATGITVVDPRDRFWLGRSTRSGVPNLQPAVNGDSGAAVPPPEFLVALLAGVVAATILAGIGIKVGCADENVVAPAFHSGVAGAVASAFLTAGGLILAGFAAASVAEAGELYTLRYRRAFITLCCISLIGGLLYLSVAIVFIRAMVRLDLRPTPGITAIWRVRLAIGSTASLVLQTVPLLTVSLVGILNVGDSRADEAVTNGSAPSSLLLATFVVNSIVTGVNSTDPIEVLFHALRTDPTELQRRVYEEFPDCTPLDQDSDETHLDAVRRFIAKVDPQRSYIISSAARHIVLDCRRNAVTPNEFFAVVWHAMAILHLIATNMVLTEEETMAFNNDDDDDGDDFSQNRSRGNYGNSAALGDDKHATTSGGDDAEARERTGDAEDEFCAMWAADGGTNSLHSGGEASGHRAANSQRAATSASVRTTGGGGDDEGAAPAEGGSVRAGGQRPPTSSASTRRRPRGYSVMISGQKESPLGSNGLTSVTLSEQEADAISAASGLGVFSFSNAAAVAPVHGSPSLVTSGGGGGARPQSASRKRMNFRTAAAVAGRLSRPGSNASVKSHAHPASPATELTAGSARAAAAERADEAAPTPAVVLPAPLVGPDRVAGAHNGGRPTPGAEDGPVQTGAVAGQEAMLAEEEDDDGSDLVAMGAPAAALSGGGSVEGAAAVQGAPPSPWASSSSSGSIEHPQEQAEPTAAANPFVLPEE